MKIRGLMEEPVHKVSRGSCPPYVILCPSRNDYPVRLRLRLFFDSSLRAIGHQPRRTVGTLTITVK